MTTVNAIQQSDSLLLPARCCCMVGLQGFTSLLTNLRVDTIHTYAITSLLKTSYGYAWRRKGTVWGACENSEGKTFALYALSYRHSEVHWDGLKAGFRQRIVNVKPLLRKVKNVGSRCKQSRKTILYKRTPENPGVLPERVWLTWLGREKPSGENIQS